MRALTVMFFFLLAVKANAQKDDFPDLKEYGEWLMVEIGNRTSGNIVAVKIEDTSSTVSMESHIEAFPVLPEESRLFNGWPKKEGFCLFNIEVNFDPPAFAKKEGVDLCAPNPYWIVTEKDTAVPSPPP